MLDDSTVIDNFHGNEGRLDTTVSTAPVTQQQQLQDEKLKLQYWRFAPTVVCAFHSRMRRCCSKPKRSTWSWNQAAALDLLLEFVV